MRTRGYAIARLTLACSLILVLAACEGIRDQLGLNKKAPDEFTVVKKAPLVLPPDFALRPPAPGAPRPQEQQPQQAARSALLGTPPNRVADRQPTLAPAPAPTARLNAPDLPVSRTVGEAALLRQANAETTDGGIRSVVDRETSALADKDRSFTDRLIFWQETPPAGTLIDAQKEAQRLRENAAIGEPVTAGESPIIKRRRRGFLEGIF